jgi:glutathione peroxidase
MKYIAIALLTTIILFSDAKVSLSNNKINMAQDTINIINEKVRNIDGQEVSLSDYKGKVLMIVNVASFCGYTPQYEGLENIYKKYKDMGLEILAFPCNDFGAQEPGSNEEIKTFCTTRYSVTFPLFDKIKVLGNEKSPLYAKLINFPPAGDISWNFEKFLIDKNGNVVARFKSKVTPESEEITSAIEKELSR